MNERVNNSLLATARRELCFTLSLKMEINQYLFHHSDHNYASFPEPYYKTSIEGRRRGRYSEQVLLDIVSICMHSTANCNYINLDTQSVLQKGATSYNPEKIKMNYMVKCCALQLTFGYMDTIKTVKIKLLQDQ